MRSPMGGVVQPPPCWMLAHLLEGSGTRDLRKALVKKNAEALNDG